MPPRKGLSAALKRKLYLIGGIVFFILGILGLFLPILQGVLFLLVSLVLLSKSSARVRLWKRRLIQRYPQWGGKLQQAEKWLHAVPGKFRRMLTRRR